MARVAVLGGTRFVGEAIVRRLLGEGHDLVLLNRGKTPSPFGGRVGWRALDRRTPGALEAAVAGESFDAVVDCTAYKPAETEAVVAAFRGRCGRFVHISTGQVYLVRRDYHPPAREADAAGPLRPRPDDPEELAEWAYGVHKVECEERLEKAWERDGFPSIRLRLPVVLGPRDHTGRLCAYAARVREGRPILARDGGRNVLRHIFVEDVAHGVELLLGPAGDALAGEALNLAQEETPTVADLVALIAQLLGVPTPPLVAITEAEARERGLGAAESPFSGRWTSVMDIARAKELLGWQPTPWRETVAAALAGCAG